MTNGLRWDASSVRLRTLQTHGLDHGQSLSMAGGSRHLVHGSMASLEEG